MLADKKTYSIKVDCNDNVTKVQMTASIKCDSDKKNLKIEFKGKKGTDSKELALGAKTENHKSDKVKMNGISFDQDKCHLVVSGVKKILMLASFVLLF